eukprot:1408112-Amphidinium_carterae.1
MGARDGSTHPNVELLAKQILVTSKSRSREVATSKAALKITVTNREKTSALAAGADFRQESEKKEEEKIRQHGLQGACCVHGAVKRTKCLSSTANVRSLGSDALAACMALYETSET